MTGTHHETLNTVRRAPFLRPLLRTAGGGLLFGICLYGTFDVASELSTFRILRTRALELAEGNEELRSQIGHPYSLGPWYNAKIGFSARGAIAQVTFQLVGEKQITDVNVRGIRDQGLPSAALYNTFGGDWRLLDCSAMFPAPGGKVRPKSLMPEVSGQALLGQSGVADGGDKSSGAASSAAAVHHFHAHLKTTQQEQAVSLGKDLQQVQETGKVEEPQKRKKWWKPW